MGGLGASKARSHGSDGLLNCHKTMGALGANVMSTWSLAPLLFECIHGEMCMADLVALEQGHSEKRGRRAMLESMSAFSETPVDRCLNGASNAIESTPYHQGSIPSLKIHPKVLERMAKRGEVPALKVGKFWRYRATTLDAWINSRLQSACQPCRTETHFDWRNYAGTIPVRKFDDSKAEERAKRLAIPLDGKRKA